MIAFEVVALRAGAGPVDGAGYLAVSHDGHTLYSAAGVLRTSRLNG